jgi:hypothetical protein
MIESDRVVARAQRRRLPLPVELNPRPTWGYNREELFGKDPWRSMCIEAGGRTDGFCEACGASLGDPVDCDPMWSWRLVVSADDQPVLLRRLSRVRALDRGCYLATHIGLAGNLGLEGAARERLRTVNGIGDPEVEAMITEAFELWRWRSTFECVTDLGPWERATDAVSEW